MELLNTMLHRRSVRQYTDEPVSKEQLDVIINAGVSGATGKGLKPVELLVVTNRDMLNKLSRSRAMGAAMLEGAGAAIIALGDEDITDTWIEDSSIAMTNMHLMADALGLGSCWIQGRMRMADENITTEDYIRELFIIPKNLRVEAILSIGNIDKHPEARTVEGLLKNKVHYETM